MSDVAWNPDQGLHLVTASGDDKNPVLKLWDLRSSTSLPLATLSGHKEGILSVSWCPTDPSLLLSCAKDNRTILWDLFHLQPVYDLPSVQTHTDQNESTEGMFGGLASSAGQRRQHVAWSPCLPAVVSASSFDRKVQFFSMVGAKSRIGRAPKWLRRPVGATFGFGGKLVTFDSKNLPVAGALQTKKSSASPVVKIYQVVEDTELVAASDLFHNIVAKGEYKHFCDKKASSPDVSAEERQVWSLMNVICFGNNAREELLTHLGFDSASITATAQEYVAKNATSKGETAGAGVDVDSLTLNDDTSVLTAEDMFGITPATPPRPPPAAVAVAPKAQPVLPEDIAKTAELWDMIQSGNAAEPTIRRAIIVGNFEAAVECCLEAGLMAEALLLAQCGDQALRVRTQAVFFEKRRHQHPFLNVLHAVIRNELMTFVLASDLNRWKETLALLSTYGKSDEFPSLCEALASRLEVELMDTSSATLCYMCAANVIRTVGFWTAELNAANAALGRMDTRALENYVEKVVVFTHANPIDSLGSECSAYFSKYAELLASQGRLSVALSYMKGQNMVENILIDRLYHAGEKAAGSRPPNFPFPRTPLEAVAVQPQQQQAAAATPTIRPAATATAATANSGFAGPAGATVTRAGSGGKTSGANTAAMAAATAAAAATTASSAYGAHGAAHGAHHGAAHSHSTTPTPAAVPAAAAGAYVLPAGWLQLVDPTSNHTYYVNQATGQSQWDAPPSAAVVAAPAHVEPAVMTSPSPASRLGGSSHSIGAAEPPGAHPAFSSAAAHETAKPVAAAATPAAAAAPAVSAADSPEGQYVVYLGQIIANLSGTCTFAVTLYTIIAVLT